MLSDILRVDAASCIADATAASRRPRRQPCRTDDADRFPAANLRLHARASARNAGSTCRIGRHRVAGSRAVTREAAGRRNSACSICRCCADEGSASSCSASSRSSRMFAFCRYRSLPASYLCRPGRDRDRERAAVQRDAGGAGAADRDRRHPASHRQLAVRRAAGVRRDREQRQPAARWPHGCGLSASSMASLILRHLRRRQSGCRRSPAKRVSASDQSIIRGPIRRTGETVPVRRHRNRR